MLKQFEKVQTWPLAVALLTATGAVIYSNSFQVEFCLDDIQVIVKNGAIRSLANLGGLFQYDPTRFLTNYSFALNYCFGKYSVWGFHLINLILHILCSALVFIFIKQTLVLYKKTNFSHVQAIFPIAFFCSLIFLVHPLQTEAVTYVVQRSTILATCFYLLSLIFYIRLRLKFSWPLFALSCLTVILGAVTKPIFVTLPLMILLYEFSFFDSTIEYFKKKPFVFLPYVAVIFLIPALLVCLTLHYLSEPFDLSKLTYATRVTSEISRGNYLLTQFYVLTKYLQLLFVPVGQNLDYDVPLSHNFFELKTLLSFGVLVVIFLAGVKIFKKHRLLAFGIFWFFITLIPESSIFPITDVMFEHRLYLPLVGFAMFLSLGLSALMSDRRKCYIYLALIALSFGILTFARNDLWKNQLVFWEDAIKKSPHKARTHLVLGSIYQKKWMLDLARKEYEMASVLDDKYLAAYLNLGRIYLAKEQYDKAAEQFNIALHLTPDDFEANLNLGNVYYYQRQLKLASSYYQKATSINPASDTPYFNLGNIYLQSKDFANAERFYLQALAHSSNSSKIYLALGNLYLAQGLHQKAIIMLEKAILTDQNLADAYNSLGVAYASAGEESKSENYFKKAVTIKHDFFMAYLNLANYYRRSNRADEAKQYFNIAAEIQKRSSKKHSLDMLIAGE